MLVSTSIVKNVAKQELRHSTRLNKTSFNRRFRSWFGLSPRVTSRVWNTLELQRKVPVGGLLKHLLWTLAFLKLYETESVYSSMFCVSDRTFRKWVWEFLAKIHTIELVSVVTTGSTSGPVVYFSLQICLISS